MMRLIFDLYPCQTGSRFRGIGRFTLSMAVAMARLRGSHQMIALANAQFPESADDLRRNLAPALPPGHVGSYSYPDLSQAGMDGETHAGIAASLIHHAYQAAVPDVVIYTTPFEGWGEQGVVPLPNGNVPSAMRVAVLYDFIPWLFPDQYLNHAAGYRQWYERRLAALPRFDLLLAISEATRRDAIAILGMPPESVVNISGAAGGMFYPMPAAEQAKHNTARFGINRPFVLYTGNADYRKNLSGMLEAYARLPAALRKTHQLVLNQVGSDIAAFRLKVRALGLRDDEVVITGHITDEELICLYTQCKLFVFPSLYEGFGLPILEAMACGAPVIAADNSSIPEVVGRPDTLFDASTPESIATALQKVLTDERLLKELRAYSIERAKFFSWDRTAKLAWEAIETRLASRQAGLAKDYVPHLSNPRIAVVCPLSTSDSPAARHCADTLPHLARHFDIDLFIEEDTTIEVPLLKAGFAVYPHTQFMTRRHRYATVVYHVADDASHAYMLPLMEQCQGVVVMHDVALDAAVRALDQAHATEREILYSHGLQGLVAFIRQGEGARPLGVNRRVLEAASQLVLPDPASVTLLDHAHRDTWLPPMTVLSDSEPAITTAACAQVIHAAIAGDEAHTVRQVADLLEDKAVNDNVVNAISGHADHNLRIRRQPRILIDVTQLAKTDANSGIQRVVKKIAYEMVNMDADQLDRPIELVRMADGKLWRAVSVASVIFGIDAGRIPEEEVEVHPGDTLLMIDSSWEQYGGFLPIFREVRALGGRIVTVIYDLIPLRMPQMCLGVLVKVFEQWFRLAAEQSDTLLCISRSVADDVTAYLAEHGTESERTPVITHWHLGADVGHKQGSAQIRPQVAQLTADKRSPLFLAVGTIEPRKGHEFILDAFDSLWQAGMDVRLCIAGQEGWHVASTMQRIRNHPLLDQKLFLVEKFNDEEINLCYASATALIAASVAEGFGLPIVEAALHRVPVLASDIPVFREVGGEGARYFSLSSPEHLANEARMIAQVPAEERALMAAKIKTLTWHQSAKELVATMINSD